MFKRDIVFLFLKSIVKSAPVFVIAKTWSVPKISMAALITPRSAIPEPVLFKRSDDVEAHNK